MILVILFVIYKKNIMEIFIGISIPVLIIGIFLYTFITYKEK